MTTRDVDALARRPSRVRSVGEWLPLPLILLGYFWLALGYARETPVWQVPDEPAHYNNVLQRAAPRPGPGPIIEDGDYPFARLEALKAARFADQDPGSIGGIEYEDHQPPLYYELAALLLSAQPEPISPVRYRGEDASQAVTAERVRLLRLLGVVLGALTVVLAWAVASTVAPGDLALRIGVTAFAAFLPMQLVMNAGVNNDALAVALTTAALLVALRRVGREPGGADGWRGALLPGLLIGLAALTKLSALLPTVVVSLAAEWLGMGRMGLMGLMGRMRSGGASLGDPDRGGESSSPIGPIGPIRPISPISPASPIVPAPRRSPFRPRLRHTAVMLILGLLLAAPWLAHNVRHYGWRDPLALAAHDRATVCPPGDSVGCQPRTADWIAEKGLADLLERGAVLTFQSFWGVFGWMGVFLGTAKGVPIYGALALSSLLALVGLLPLLRRWRRWPGRLQAQALILALHLAMTGGGFLWYNLTFVQQQGRYLLPALLPIALAYCAGLRGVVGGVAGRLGFSASRARGIGNLGLLVHSVALATLAWLSLRSYIIPGLGGHIGPGG